MSSLNADNHLLITDSLTFQNCGWWWPTETDCGAQGVNIKGLATIQEALNHISQAWWCKPATTALRRKRKEGWAGHPWLQSKFKASMGASKYKKGTRELAGYLKALTTKPETLSLIPGNPRLRRRKPTPIGYFLTSTCTRWCAHTNTQHTAENKLLKAKTRRNIYPGMVDTPESQQWDKAGVGWGNQGRTQLQTTGDISRQTMFKAWCYFK